MSKLAGKVAVVTGASKGIGASIARHLAEAGADVVVNYATSRAGADQVVADIVKNGGRALAVQANVREKIEVQRLLGTTVKEFGRLDILINNAGVYEVAPLEQITGDHFHRMFDLNVLGLIYASQEAVRHFGEKGGNIVNVSSVVSTLSPAGMAVYSGTKAAVDSITRALAKELAGRNVRINSVNPGMVETEGLLATGLLSGSSAESPEGGKVGKPDDVAPAVVFLASGDSSHITGETLYIAAGQR